MNDNVYDVNVYDVNAYDVVDNIINYENGSLTLPETLVLFKYLLNTGKINALQGSYQRQAKQLLDTKLIVIGPDGYEVDWAHVELDDEN